MNDRTNLARKLCIFLPTICYTLCKNDLPNLLFQSSKINMSPELGLLGLSKGPFGCYSCIPILNTFALRESLKRKWASKSKSSWRKIRTAFRESIDYSKIFYSRKKCNDTILFLDSQLEITEIRTNGISENFWSTEVWAEVNGKFMLSVFVHRTPSKHASWLKTQIVATLVCFCSRRIREPIGWKSCS